MRPIRVAFAGHTVTPFITAGWKEDMELQGFESLQSPEGPPLSTWLYTYPCFLPPIPRASLCEQDGDFPPPFPYWSFAWLGAPALESIGVRERAVVLAGHMKQVARTSAATLHALHPKPLLPTAATAKTISFFCFPHLKKGHQPNCGPWPCFIFPTCILLTPFSYGTYGACHQMTRRHILRFWWEEQQWAMGDALNNFCSKYISCTGLSSIWVSEPHA